MPSGIKSHPPPSSNSLTRSFCHLDDSIIVITGDMETTYPARRGHVSAPPFAGLQCAVDGFSDCMLLAISATMCFVRCTEAVFSSAGASKTLGESRLLPVAEREQNAPRSGQVQDLSNCSQHSSSDADEANSHYSAASSLTTPTRP